MQPLVLYVTVKPAAYFSKIQKGNTCVVHTVNSFSFHSFTGLIPQMKKQSMICIRIRHMMMAIGSFYPD